MRGEERTPSVGELVRVGDGAVWPLTLPITLIGSGDQCDVRLPAAGVAELHCALSLTPAGLALRSWNPDATFLGDRPTAAALLADGQEIRIGLHRFRLIWNVAVEPESVASAAALLDQVHIAREQFRIDKQRAGVEIDRKVVKFEKAELRLKADERAVAVERERIRAIYRRCLNRLKAKWAAERSSAGQERLDLERSQDQFREFAERRRNELDARAERLNDDKARVQAAWELLAEGQRRTIADRRESEDWLARQRDALELRTKMFHEQQKLFESNRPNLDGRQPALIAEIAGLEARATHLRQAIDQLDAKRDRKLADGERVDSFTQAAVSLAVDRVPRSVANQANSLLSELQEREQELGRERQAQANLRSELETQAAELADQRAILAEQIAALAAARNLWLTAETQTVDELHSLALGVRSGEQSLDERERDVYSAERRRRNEDHTLAELRFKLENWHVALAAKELSVQSEADRLEDQLRAKQEQMDRWEQALGLTAASWASLRDRETGFLHAELDRLASAQEEHARATAEARGVHAELTRQLGEVAARDLAQTGDAQGTTRRVRVLEKRWMAHFRREEKRLARLDDRLRREEQALDERNRRLQGETADFLERQRTESQERTALDRERLVAERKLYEVTSEAELETHLRFRTEEDARRLRGEIARMAQSILTANLSSPDEPDAVILPLQAAQAA